MEKNQQSKVMMILICFLIGQFGVHRLMMGYKNWWLQLITFGGLGIWQLIDLIRIIIGDMKMEDGRDLI
jgi:TM2 domain-containing membrane protein YozV